MGLIHVTVALRRVDLAGDVYEADFLVDTGATDSLVPASALRGIGVPPVGRMAYELADGTLHEYEFGVARIVPGPCRSLAGLERLTESSGGQLLVQEVHRAERPGAARPGELLDAPERAGVFR